MEALPFLCSKKIREWPSLVQEMPMLENADFSQWSELHAFLRSLQKKRTLETFVVHAAVRKSTTSLVCLGMRHSKFPEHTSLKHSVQITLETAAGLFAEVSLTTFDLNWIQSRVLEALTLAAPLKQKPLRQKHSHYPDFPLVHQELVQCFENGNAAATAAQLALQLDEQARKTSHPRLMGREVSASLGLSTGVYFDSLGNRALERSGSVDLSCVYSLSDSIESYADTFGSLPSALEVEEIAKRAARNLTLSDVSKLASVKGTPVLLTSMAFVSLLEDLVIPNLGAGNLLRKTGRWEAGAIGQKVLGGLTLFDNPHKPYSPFSSTFDAEGTPTQPVTIAKEGVLAHPLLTSVQHFQILHERPDLENHLQLTGHATSLDDTGFSNVTVQLQGAKEMPWDGLCESVPEFVQVHNLTGMSVDPLSGQFALDVDGAKVYRSGKLAYSTSLTLRGNIMAVLEEENLVTLPPTRTFNYWAPSVLTRSLTCVAKEMGAEEERVGDEEELEEDSEH
jgi:predicted Zn-dependent protease